MLQDIKVLVTPHYFYKSKKYINKFTINPISINTISNDHCQNFVANAINSSMLLLYDTFIYHVFI